MPKCKKAKIQQDHGQIYTSYTLILEHRQYFVFAVQRLQF